MSPLSRGMASPEAQAAHLFGFLCHIEFNNASQAAMAVMVTQA
jgi:hypothetical protein